MQNVKDIQNDGLAWTDGWTARTSDTTDETKGSRAIVAEDASGDTKLTLASGAIITTYLHQGIPRTLAVKRVWSTGSTPTSFTLWR